MTRRTPWAAAPLLLIVGACLTACVQVPDSGPVVQSEEPVEAPAIDNPYNNPPPPEPGASAAGIVSGFLDAMTATPLQTRVAVKYLTNAAASSWKPRSGGVVAYAGLVPPHGESVVKVRLRGAERVDAGGEWLGPVGPAASRLTFPMRKENGEWRIAAAPNALLVPRTFYEQTFQDAALYYFDPTGRILVPEVVHVPQGQQLITALVNALLLGPQASLSGVVRTFVPPGLTVAPLIVSKGSVNIALSGAVPDPLSRTTTRLMLSQFAWTLRQDPTVRTFSLSISGRQVTDASGASTFRVENPDADRYDPAYPPASSQLYALRRGLLVSGQASRLDGRERAVRHERAGDRPVRGQPRRRPGRRHDAVLAAAGAGAERRRPDAGPHRRRPAASGLGLRRPALGGAEPGAGRRVVLSVHVTARGRSRFPGVSGEDVRHFLVSRDGSRLVAVLRGTSATGSSSAGSATTTTGGSCPAPARDPSGGRPGRPPGSATSGGCRRP